MVLNAQVRNAAVKKVGIALTVLWSIGMLAGCTAASPGGTARSPAASGTPSPTATAPTAADIPGVAHYVNAASHVNGPVKYAESPPVGGAHSPVWLNCGIYTAAVPNENAVHDLEHGAVWVTYDPALAVDQIAALRALLPATHTLMSPYAGMDSPIVISAWNVQLKVATASDPRLAQFVTQYRNSRSAPEPGAPCTGGLDAPGRLSSSTA